MKNNINNINNTNNIFNHKLSQRLNFNLETNSQVQLLLTQIDNYKGQWSGNKNLSGQFLKQLTKSIIASSTGASTRIEGSKLNDKEVERIIKEGKLRKISTRDEQEVVGYFEILENVFEDYSKVTFNQRTILEIHSILLKYSEKDTRHRGGYKLNSNQVVAIDNQNQVIGVIFDPASVQDTPIMMKELISWTTQALKSQAIHPILVIANFIFEFLSIHPFKDGNGRASRVLTNLLLLQNGYDFTRFVSHEKLIEEAKTEYYIALRQSSKTWNTPDEDISQWILFILTIFSKQAKMSVDLFNSNDTTQYLSNYQTIIWNLFLQGQTLSRKDIFKATNIPLSTIEHSIRKLLSMNKLDSLGEGRSRRYRVRGGIS
jgi:Fic family protein